MNSLPSSLYIHVPFCERKCNYCAFESHVPKACEKELYLYLIEKELALRLKGCARPKLKTCYFGGGTPTLLSSAEWKSLIEIIEKFFDFEPDAEVTVEANPNSLNAAHLLEWRDWRVTRVSLGIQSFDDAELSLMGRLHSARQAHDAISASIAAGFSVNGDFIFALPYQTFENWARTLKEAAHCGLRHISLYQLTIEENTPWAELDTSLLSDGYSHYRFAQWYFSRKGYEQYEIANFAQHGYESRHNINYWNEGTYLGIGPSASSYIDGVRMKNQGNIFKYKQNIEDGVLPVENQEELTYDALAREAAVLALRMTRGFDIQKFAHKYGNENLNLIIKKMKQFPDDLYSFDNKTLSLTKKGMRVANIIWTELI